MQATLLVAGVVFSAAASTFLYHDFCGPSGNAQIPYRSGDASKSRRVLQSSIPSSDTDESIAEELSAADELLVRNRRGQSV